MTIITTDTALLRLLQLSSAALPIGGYSFSQGMESAVEEGYLPDAGATRQWLVSQLHNSLSRVDLPLLQRLLGAARIEDLESLAYWNHYSLACRETAELRLADTAMGEALRRLLRHLEVPIPLEEQAETSFVTAFALAAHHFDIESRAACNGYAWAWLENQVAAAIKLVPLGQSAAQTLLGQVMEQIPAALDTAAGVHDDHIGASLPGLAMVSAMHETQYSRLFRS